MNCLFVHFTKEKEKNKKGKINKTKQKSQQQKHMEKEQADSVRQKAKQDELFALRQLLPLLLPVQVLCTINATRL